MTGADWVLLAFIGAGGLLGLRRGGISGVLDLVALAIGFTAVLFATPRLNDLLVGMGIDYRWLVLSLVFTVFGVVAGLSGLLLRLIGSPLGLATKVPPFGLLDSLIGIGPGVVKGGLVAVVMVLALIIQFPATDAAERIRAWESGEFLAEIGSRGYGWAGDRAGVDLEGLTALQVAPGQSIAGSASSPNGDLDSSLSGEAEALRLVNAARTAEGLRALESIADLTAIARSHASDAGSERGRDRSANAADVGDRLEEAGVRCLAAGAALGVGDSVEDAVAAMLRSPEHRAVLLSGTYLWSGFGVLTGSDGQSIVVGVFTL